MRKDDFTIFENGNSRSIVGFEATTPGPETQRSLLPIRSTAELDQKLPDAPVSIIVLDELTSKFEDQHFARYSLEKYLSRQSEVLNQPMMLVARTVNRMMVLHDYTTSKKEILDTLKRHFVGNDWEVKDPDRAQEKVGAVFASLIELAKATQGHPGHKNLVWIGRGFPAVHWDNLNFDQVAYYKSSLASCINLMRDARMTLYVLDPGGIALPPFSMDANGISSIDDPFGGEVNLDSMAFATGGQSLHGRNDVDRMIATAIHNGEQFYTLAYRPSESENEMHKEFRSIRVVLKDKNLSAIHRAGYYPGSVLAPPALRDNQGKFSHLAAFDLSAASQGLMVFDGIPLSIARSDADPNHFQISLPASSIGLQDKDGKRVAELTLLTLSYDQVGKLLDRKGRVISLHLPTLGTGENEKRKIEIGTTVDTQSPAARIRFVIRANQNGRVGADNYFLTDRNTLKDPATGVKANR